MVFDRLVQRVLSGPVEAAVARALAERDDSERSEDPLQRMLVHGDASRLDIHPSAVVNNALFNVSGGTITVGEHAFFGHSVSVLTGVHDVDKLGLERQRAIIREGRDVDIAEGVWVTSHAIIVGPCHVGAHAVVGVGSVVLDDVEAYTVVAGVPAKPIRTIARPEGP